MIRARSSKPPPQPTAPPAPEIPRSRSPTAFSDRRSPPRHKLPARQSASRSIAPLPPNKLPANATRGALGSASGNQSACSRASRDPAPPTAARATPRRPLQSPSRSKKPVLKKNATNRQTRYSRPPEKIRSAIRRAAQQRLVQRRPPYTAPVPPRKFRLCHGSPNRKIARSRARIPRANPPEFPSARALPSRPASILPRTAYQSVARPHPRR